MIPPIDEDMRMLAARAVWAWECDDEERAEEAEESEWYELALRYGVRGYP